MIGLDISQLALSLAVFFLSEGYPLVGALAEENAMSERGLTLGFSYLSQPEPKRFSSNGSYAQRDKATRTNQTVQWSWSIGDVLSALIQAALRIDALTERAEGFYPATPVFLEG